MEVTCELMYADFPCASFYTFARECGWPKKSKEYGIVRIEVATMLGKPIHIEDETLDSSSFKDE